MSYINKDLFDMLANPAIVEQVNADNDFDSLVSIIDATVYQLTKIDVPALSTSTPKWLIPHIVAIMSKYVLNRLQSVSDELRNQINNDYELALNQLRSVKITDAISSVVNMPNMLNTDNVYAPNNWSVYE